MGRLSLSAFATGVTGVAGGIITALTVASCVVSCMEPPAKAPDPAAAAPTRDTLLGEPFDVEAVAEQVAAFRGLPLRAAVPIRVIDDGATRHHVVAYDEVAAPTGPDAFWSAIDVVVPDRAASPAPTALFAKGVSALFDEKRTTLWARRPGETNDGERAWALVHAIEHVLQEQNAILPARGLDDDQALARRAVLEGDADLTTAAFIASRRPSGDHWLAHLLSEVANRGERVDVFAGAPPYVRRQWLFPYVDGFRLVASVYRAGGFPLVNRMFARPPISTEQVLWPAAYIAGELPIRIEPPAVPSGFTSVAVETVGELRTRAWLDQCPTTGGSRSMGNWGGDSLAVVRDASGRPALLWSTAWDGDTAASFEAQLQRTRAGWWGPDGAPTKATPSCTNLNAGPDATVVHDADRVVYVKGLDGAPAAAAARALMARPIVHPSPVPPLGDVQLRPIDDPVALLGHGELEGTVYVNKGLGLRVPTAGFQIDATAPGEEVTLGEAFGVSTLQLTVSALMTASSPELEQRLAKDTVGGFEGVDRTVEYLGDTPLVTDAGPGHALRWFGREGTNQILVFVPVCGGKITLVAHGRGEGPGLWREAKRALHGMRFDPAGHACKMVADDTPPSSPPPSSPVAPALPAPAASSPPVASAPTPPPAPITLPASASPARR